MTNEGQLEIGRPVLAEVGSHPGLESSERMQEVFLHFHSASLDEVKILFGDQNGHEGLPEQLHARRGAVEGDYDLFPVRNDETHYTDQVSLGEKNGLRVLRDVDVSP